MRILLWLRMKWLLFRQTQIENKIQRENLSWEATDKAGRAAHDELMDVTRRKNDIRKRLGRSTD